MSNTEMDKMNILPTRKNEGNTLSALDCYYVSKSKY